MKRKYEGYPIQFKAVVEKIKIQLILYLRSVVKLN